MIEILSIPPLASVQDLGRHGQWHQGLGQAGAMDVLAHRIVNLLLGNPAEAATIEIPLTPARLRFPERSAFAIAGAACGAKLDGRALPRVWAGVAEAGAVLELGPITQGARVYLGLPGGMNVPLVIGSRSTQLREGFGGLEGRVLAAGDVLRGTSQSVSSLPPSGLSLSLPPLSKDGEILLRALPSSEHGDFSAEAQQAFWSTPYRVTQQSNRQGYRLEGATLDYTSQGELRSHGIVPGIVQVPGGGQPIIQLADSATMGGYPKIAAVIEADQWLIGQAREGDILRFHRIDLAEAAEAERQSVTYFDDIARAVHALTAQQKGWE
jgi:5-oxoprolinase (ATP-hydrolysing) subunit C